MTEPNENQSSLCFDLRDRIAAAIEECPMPVDGQEWSELLADAVIRELGPSVRYWDKDFKELHYCRECGGWGPME